MKLTLEEKRERAVALHSKSIIDKAEKVISKHKDGLYGDSMAHFAYDMLLPYWNRNRIVYMALRCIMWVIFAIALNFGYSLLFGTFIVAMSSVYWVVPFICLLMFAVNDTLTAWRLRLEGF